MPDQNWRRTLTFNLLNDIGHIILQPYLRQLFFTGRSVLSLRTVIWQTQGFSHITLLNKGIMHLLQRILIAPHTVNKQYGGLCVMAMIHVYFYPCRSRLSDEA